MLVIVLLLWGKRSGASAECCFRWKTLTGTFTLEWRSESSEHTKDGTGTKGEGFSATRKWGQEKATEGKIGEESRKKLEYNT